jgi:phosphatidylethanolamine/phosphatidyl-N-methylethanolamine N-methyltransferase
MTTTIEKDRRYWERHAKKYDLSLRLLRRPLPRMLQLAREATTGAARVLEVAAGTGLVTTELARVAGEVIVTDYATEMVALLEKKVRDARLANVHCEQADLYALRFEPASFDVVVAANVLHLVPDLPGAIRALRRVLKPSGRLVVPTFCHDETPLSWVVSRVIAVTRFPNKRRFSAKSLRESLEAEGLSVNRAETLHGLIPIGYVDGVFGG